MKILCLFLSLALAAGLFVSCGRQDRAIGPDPGSKAPAGINADGPNATDTTQELQSAQQPSGEAYPEPDENETAVSLGDGEDPDLPEDYGAETVIPEDERPETVVVSQTKGRGTVKVSATPKTGTESKGQNKTEYSAKTGTENKGQSQRGNTTEAETETAGEGEDPSGEEDLTPCDFTVTDPSEQEDVGQQEDGARTGQTDREADTMSENREMAALAEKVLKTARVSGSQGNYKLSWTQPEIPEKYHLRVEFSAYAKGDAEHGNCCLEYYCSDEGYLSDPSEYDASQGKKTHKIEPTVLKGRKLYVVVRVFRSDFSGDTFVRSASMDFDGTVSGDASGIFTFE